MIYRRRNIRLWVNLIDISAAKYVEFKMYNRLNLKTSELVKLNYGCQVFNNV